MDSEKARENRLRRAAERRGFVLQRSRRRDPQAIGYGQYQLIDAATGAVASLTGREGWMTIDQAEIQLGFVTQDQDPAVTRLVRATAAVALAVQPAGGLDSRTEARLLDPINRAAAAMKDGTTAELRAAVREILAAPPPAPRDQARFGELFDELRAALAAYESAHRH